MFDAGDVVKVPDGFDCDFGTFGWMVGIGHVSSSLNVKFLHNYSILLNISRELKNADSFKLFLLFVFLLKVKFYKIDAAPPCKRARSPVRDLLPMMNTPHFVRFHLLFPPEFYP